MAFEGPGWRSPGAMPSARARGRCWAPTGRATALRRRAVRRMSTVLGCRLGRREGNLQAIDERRLRRIHLLPCHARIEPGAAIDLGKGEPSARAPGPLSLHRVAGHLSRIGIAFPGPGMDQLARLLP